jgi:hypothetical protein
VEVVRNPRRDAPAEDEVMGIAPATKWQDKENHRLVERALLQETEGNETLRPL